MKKSLGILIAVWAVIALIIIGIIIVGFSLYTLPGVTREGQTMSDIYIDETLPINDIDTIQLHMSAATVTVRHAESGDFRIVQSGRNIEDNHIIDVKKSGSTIEVTPKGSRRIQLFSFSLPNNSDNVIDVYIPAEYAKDVKIKLSAGDLDIIDAYTLDGFDVTVSAGDFNSTALIQSKESQIKLSAGNLELSQLECDDFDVSTSAGKLVIHALSGSGKASASAGEVRLESVEIADSLTVRSSAGSVKIGIAGDPGLDYRISASAGSIETYFADVSGFARGKNASGKVGDGPYKNIDISSSAGSIKIDRA
ncbi:MAG: DUF4097 domain-containing protein [Oscillospiraceae bacterium]|jgi:lia operon protein LiaG|nr:DUF4097 domain-containing protein [Oscillospiraceae bacterium]